ncbi:glutamate synthase subunit beta [Bacteroides fragilis]|uniref:glutamate synthase subunit beta n=1 Tax=Bacteroides fragilis TaxID=817 RepID=UPI00044DBC76|nr:glutamate synthase subunit beta [Bacteroides fragilis]EXZ05058.1 glutamate synthase, NADH/NADPH, small subunit domain protein [Bacteroides fragilis str. DS-208]MCE8971936.1 glutamate synthase subunit beta [Bacteroides fragilis]
MGDPKAFLNIPRHEAGYRPVHERVTDFSEVEQTLNTSDRKLQASRCMDCGVPFCHWACPLGNKQPEWQDALYKGKWCEAYQILSVTCDFPEFTGRICPALCEKSCVLKLSCDEPVTIRENEAAIVETAFREGYITPVTPIRNGKRVAVIGAGPAGLTVANRLNRSGHTVTVFDKAAAPGGLLRYGIPNFKLNKIIIDRRMKLLAAEGIEFRMNTNFDTNQLTSDNHDSNFDAYCICTGAETPRDLNIPGRELKGIHFALEMLSQQNRIIEGENFPKEALVNAKDKKVLVIGGGDTGSDCIGTSIRQGAASVTQIEIMPKPPVAYNPATPWPQWPVVLKTTSSHEEGCIRRWSLASNRFIGKNGKVTGVEVEEVEWIPATGDGRPTMKPTGKKETIEADMVLLAMGFLRPEQPKFAGNVFMAGDASTGASLVVRAMASGRAAAAEIERHLKMANDAK